MTRPQDLNDAAAFAGHAVMICMEVSRSSHSVAAAAVCDSRCHWRAFSTFRIISMRIG